jgi:hypothetical protein
MTRIALVLGMLLALGVMKLPAEHALSLQHRAAAGGKFDDVVNLDLREKIEQLGSSPRSAGSARCWRIFSSSKRT